MKTIILPPPRALPPVLLRATKSSAGARRIFLPLLIAGSVSLAAVAAALPAWADSSPSVIKERPFIDENNAACRGGPDGIKKHFEYPSVK